MSKINLAVLVKVNKRDVIAAQERGALDELRKDVYNDIFQFIREREPKNFLPCVPSSKAWGQKVYEQFGVLFGATEPALFSYFHIKSQTQQEMQVMKQIATCGLRVFDNFTEDSGKAAYLLEGDVFSKDPWFKTLLSGGFLYDAGVYSMAHKKAALDDADNENVKKSYADYAICILDVFGQE